MWKPSQISSHRAGRARVQAVHGDEEMGGVARPPHQGFADGVVTRVGVGDGNRADRLDFPNEIHGAGLLRRDIHQLYAAARRAVQLPEFLDIRRADEGAVLGPLFRRRDVGSLHVDAVGVSAGQIVPAEPHIGEYLLQLLIGQGHGGGAEGGDAPLRQAGGDSLQRLGGRIAGVRARAAVDMDIDKAGQQGHAAEIQRLAPLSAFPRGLQRADQRPLHRHVRPDGQKFAVVYDGVF